MEKAYQEIVQRYLPQRKVIVDYVANNLLEVDKERFLLKTLKIKEPPQSFLDFLIRQAEYALGVVESLGLDVRAIEKTGDFHCGNKATLKLKIDHYTLYYKPISFANIEFILLMLKLLNQEGFHFPLIQLIKETKFGYFLRELVADTEFKDHECFYKHAGAIITLTHVFRFYDMHRENFIVSQSVPVPIDCECFLFPKWHDMPPYNLAGTLLFETPANDKPLLIKGELTLNNIKNLEEGVMRAWKALGKKHVEIINELRMSHNRLSSRMILKPTKYYSKLISLLFHPDVFFDDSKREEYVRQSLTGKHKISSSIVNHEVMDVLQYDVPYFTYREGTLFDSKNAAVKQDLIEPIDVLHLASFLLKNEALQRLLKEINELINW